MITICQLIEEIKNNFEELKALNAKSKMHPTITRAYGEISGYLKN